MARRFVFLSLLTVVVVFSAASALAQAPQTPAPAGSPAFYAIPYGPPITLEEARKAADAAIAEARKNNWLMVAVVVDPDGELIYLERMDNVQSGSVKVAQGKARSAAIFKRPTKMFEDGVAKGGAGLRVLGLEGAVPLEGGLPLVVDGKIVGAIGLSGDLSENDGKCAKAGADTLAKR